MMKKITLLILTIFTSLTSWSQMVVFEESFTDFTALAAPPPTGWVTLNEDTLTVNPFYTDQGAFLGGNWEHENFGAPFSSGIFSCSDASPTGQPVSNWLISPQITLLVNPLFEIEAVSAVPGSVEVRYTTSIAGATPVASDFTNVLGTFNTTGAYALKTIDISSIANQSVYFAFIDNNIDGDILGMKNFRILEPLADDLKLNEITFDERKTPMEGFIVDYASFCNKVTVDVSINVTNTGINPITSFEATYDNTSTIATQTFTIPSLASGQSTTVTFAVPANVDTFAAYFIDAWVNMTGDGEQSNDSTLNNGNFTLMIALDPDTITTTNSFYTSFEQFDGNNIANFGNAFWTTEDTDGNGNKFTIQQGLDDYTSDGTYTMYLRGNPNSSNTDWAFSPCMYFDAAKFYRIRFKSRVGSYNTGEPVPATLDLHLMSDDNSTSSVAMVGSVVSDDNVSMNTEYSVSFSPLISGIYNIGIHQATGGQDWSVSVDEFVVEELVAPTAPTISTSWNACDGEATLTFSYDPLLTYDVNWGDGNNETITSGNVTHSYTPGSSYNVIVTASNFAGSNPSSASNLNALALMAPDAIFTLTQTGASVAVSVDNDLPCNTYSWTWGDNTNNSSGSSETHLYTATGTYTLELYAQNSAGSNTKTREVVINVDGVDEIDFVNGISVFPNPVNDELNINFELNTVQNVNITLISIDGKVMAEINADTNVVTEKINTSKLSSGLYIVNVRTNEGVYTRNIMVK